MCHSRCELYNIVFVNLSASRTSDLSASFPPDERDPFFDQPTFYPLYLKIVRLLSELGSRDVFLNCTPTFR